MATQRRGEPEGTSPVEVMAPAPRSTEGGLTRASAGVRGVIWVIAAYLLVVATFILDISLPYGHDAGYLYIPAIVLAGLSRRTSAVLGTAVAAGALVLVGHFLELRPDTTWTAWAFSRGATEVALLLTALVVSFFIVREGQARALAADLARERARREDDLKMIASARELGGLGTWTMVVENQRLTGSPEAAAIVGFEVGSHPEFEDILAMLSSADAEPVREALEATCTTGAPFREEGPLRTPDGERWVMVMGEAVPSSDGTITQVRGTIQDITPLRDAQASAVQAHRRFSRFAETLPIIVWTADADGNIEYFNKALQDYTGETDDNLLGDRWGSTVHPDDLERVESRWSRCVATGTPYDIEFRVRGADGQYEWHHLMAQPERDGHGDIVRWWGSSVNVNATRQLREEAERLRRERETILESISDGVTAIDREWRVVYMNSEAKRVIGPRADNLIGERLDERFPEMHDNPFGPAVKAAIERGARTDFRYYDHTNHTTLDVAVTPSDVGATINTKDVTEVTQLADRLAQAQRLESIGRLTGGIAHDFNNVLTVVMGGADAIASDESAAAHTREMASMVLTAARRGGDLTGGLLAFARRTPLEPRPTDLWERLTGIAPLLHRTLGDEVDLVVTPTIDLPLVEVDPSEFENALVNLAINARDAMPRGGRVTIEASAFTVDDSTQAPAVDMSPGDYVVVSVTDTGHGIAKENLDHLFDPFFTTKEVGKGTGLGLAMVWGFVKQTGGHIAVYSEEGMGTTFRMYLPQAHVQQLPTSSELPQAPLPARGDGLILLAEDDDLVRAFAVDQLTAHGFSVVDAASGPEALDLLEGLDHIDLLFTDVVMPGGMSGKDLADAVTEARPGVPVLFASGYTEDVVVHNGRLDDGIELLSKPYSSRQLLRRVHEMLDGGTL